MATRARDTPTVARVLAVLLALLALVALAADAGVPWGAGDPRDRTVASGAGGYLVMAVVLGTSGAAAFLLIRSWRRRRSARKDAEDELEEEESGPSAGLERLLVSLMAYVLAAVIAVAFFLVVRQADRWLPDGGGASPTATTEERTGVRSGGGSRADLTWWLTAAVLLLAAGASTAALWTPARRRRPRHLSGLGHDGSGGTNALVALVEETVDDLRAEHDARRAIIAAYARMERGLARKGVPRRAWEAPVEYLGRVLRELRADSGHVGRLTNLFEHAKFSREEMPTDAKGEAIDCLLAIRGDAREAE
ncbi:MAG: DUF4129 domain-containing protein [Actinomycetota bacterium]|nr:DUF4129 domain-containing protein [Actinomycetota bacterium]